MTTLERARSFIYRNARPLDLARWQFHFEGGSPEAVLNALSYYQNADGGFGHAVEADSWNPNSTPIQTWAATEILKEIGYSNQEHPMIQGVLRYLASGQDFNGHFWVNAVKSNNDYPHAPWWHTESGSTSHNSYNPTACLAGFLLRFAPKDAALYDLGSRLAREAFGAYVQQGLLNDMHTVLCYIRLLQYCQEAGATDVIDLPALKDRLLVQVKSSITTDTDSWKTGYVCRPSQFFGGRDSIFYAGNREIAEFECEHILETQLDDGSWNIPWSWAGYPEEWAISKNWWKANGILVNLLYLKGFGRLQ